MIYDPRGFDSVIKYLLGEIDAEQVYTEHKVTGINRSEEKVTVLTNQGEFTAQHVIVTASIGVLNSGMISFDPPLPDWKIEALAAQKMATYVKIFAGWDEKWWKDSDFAPSTPDGMSWVILMDGEGDDNERWKVMGPQPTKKPILHFTAIDKEGIRVEGLSDEEVKAEITEKLRKAYPNRNVPEPDYIKKTDWYTNELT